MIWLIIDFIFKIINNIYVIIYEWTKDTSYALKIMLLIEM